MCEKRGTSGSDRRCIRGGWHARKRLGQCIVAACISACRLGRCMQARSAHRRMQAGLLGACIACFYRGGVRRRLMQGMAQRNHGPTVEQRHHPTRPHLSGQTDDTV